MATIEKNTIFTKRSKSLRKVESTKTLQDMKTSELISLLQQELQNSGDKKIVIAANKHSYRDVKLVSKDDVTTLALFDKIPD